MKRILVVSKFRDMVGGVETHIETLVRGLRGRDLDVEIFTADDLVDLGVPVFDSGKASNSKLSSVKNLLWNSDARAHFAKACTKFRPDVIHYHSIYHQLSPSVLAVSETPSVMTLHDFKLVAPCYSLTRDGAYCEKCVTGSVINAVRYKCVKNSGLASAVCGLETRAFQGRYRNTIDRFIVPSAFSRDRHVRGGLDPASIAVVPWGVPPAAERSTSVWKGSRYWIYSGRLHPSKGVLELLDVWSRLRDREGIQLLVAGDGELADQISGAAHADGSIGVLGRVPSDQLSRLVANAELALVPSISPETFGLTALEALRAGTPIVSTGAGALADLRGAGVFDGSKAVREWLPLLQSLVGDPSTVDKARHELETRDLTRFTVEAMVDSITAEYSTAIGRRRHPNP
ncbi:glycosyltransferase family 4 protein [Rhodococcoides corynebacterioides]|uniref:glycosyltransferase family 4 protein n=1 Tax=Rhodococcoides corynebacterioides TaxID=53972 RepID=UPI003AEA020A